MEVVRRFSELKRVPLSMRVEVYVDGEGNLNFDSPRLRSWMACTGTWEGVVSINVKLLRDFTKDMPNGNPLVIEVRDSFLHIGSLGLDCRRVG